MEYIKDGQPHTYTVNFNLKEKKTFLLRGLLYDLDNFPDEMEKHALFENIILRYTYVPA
jgi:predicted hydrolase (HD superfamily)